MTAPPAANRGPEEDRGRWRTHLPRGAGGHRSLAPSRLRLFSRSHWPLLQETSVSSAQNLDVSTPRNTRTLHAILACGRCAAADLAGGDGGGAGREAVVEAPELPRADVTVDDHNII
jgi:hypothetical protein